MENTAKAKWSNGLANELEHWEHWLRRSPAIFPGGVTADVDTRLDPNTSLESYEPILEHLEPFAPAGSTVSILDVGAGPLTVLPKKWAGRAVVITAVDPLAADYDRMLAEVGVVPPVRTQYGEAERLLEQFPPDYFDMVTCCNALDHTYDPLKGIRQMLSVVKPGRALIMLHNQDEAEGQHYYGLHQWNFNEKDGEFIIWNREVRYSVNRELGADANVRVDRPRAPNHVLVYLTKNRPGVL